MADKQSEGSFLMGFIVGGVVGVVAGLVLAPKPGSETRADLADYGEVVRERAEEVAAQVVHLCDPRYKQMTGGVVLMDGGLSLTSSAYERREF